MKRYEFRWVQWNLDHATKHGVSVAECERVVSGGKYRQAAGGKYRAVGRGDGPMVAGGVRADGGR